MKYHLIDLIQWA